MSGLSSYTVKQGLGVGSFGKVKLGVHKLTGEEVALKFLDKRKVVKNRVLDKLRKEISILSSLSHANIISLHEVIETEDSIVLVTEYVPGGELYEQIEGSGKLSESRAHEYFTQLIEALAYCHSHHVAHRDIKLENLLIGNDGNLKLADFGLASFIQDGEFLNTACGSPNYAPPEILMGKVYDGPTADVWSSGVVLYAITTGCLPFDEVSMAVLHGKIRGGIYKDPYYLPDALKDLIARMLDINAVSRISIEQIKRHPWVCREPVLFRQVLDIDKCKEMRRPPCSNKVKFSNQEVLEDLRSPKESNVFKFTTKQRTILKQDYIPMFKYKNSKTIHNKFSLRNDETAASSPGSQEDENYSPNCPGWCYGLAISVDLGNFIQELIGFLETNQFIAKQTGKSRVLAERGLVSLDIKCFTYGDQYFANVRLVKGSAMIGLETAYKVLSFIQPYAY